MTIGKELVLAAIKLEETKRVPWVPFVGCHGGFLIGKGADEYLKSSELMIEGQKKAAEIYAADGIPVSFDLQVEAEALGCDLKWEKLNPPAVSSHILNSKKLSELKIPTLSDARIPAMMEAAKGLRKELPDKALYGLITGPFTLALHLMGSNLFMEMYDDPEGLLELIAFCTEVGKVMIDGYIEAGCDIIAIVDPMTSQIGPDHFREFVTPGCTELFTYIRDRKKLSSFFVCGHALKNLEVMCECCPDNLSVDENIPLDVVKKICLEHNVSFGGNLRLTTSLLNGTADQNSIHAYKCLESGGTKGYLLAPGCDLPYETPIENMQAVSEVATDEYKNEIAGTLAEKGIDEESKLFDMSEYGRYDKVIVDIITLDSEACAPCQYMVESVKAVVPQFEELVIWREHKIKSQESVQFMASLMVKNVPTICIDGAIKFVSVIPSRDELIQAIQARINKKFRIRIRRKQHKLLILSDGSDKSEEAAVNVETAIKELGVNVESTIIDDKEVAESYGVKKYPGIVLCQTVLKTWDEVPEVKIIKEWLKDLD